jgi:predicted dienelactone hydrolase
MVPRMAARLLVVLALLVPALAAGAPPDPSGFGRYPAGVTSLSVFDDTRGRMLHLEIWYPATVSGRDAKPARGRFPLVLLAHGSCGFRTNYEYLSEALARFGFLVAAPDFPGMTRADCVHGFPQGRFFDDPALDLRFLRERLATPRTGVLAGRVRGGRRVGLVGSSLGGFAVLKASSDDPHFTAVVALAALASAPNGEAFATLKPPRAVLSFAGTADRLLPPASFAVPFFAELPAPSFLVTIAGGTHGGFSDSDASLSPAALERQHDLVRRYTIAFLGQYLARDRRFKRVLTPQDATAQGSDVTLEARTR